MARQTLLLVDDSEAMLAYERAALGEHYELVVAKDGIGALTLLGRMKKDGTAIAGVLLDLSMPRMNGEEVLARMRGDVAWRDVPVVVVSSEAERARALADRIDAFVQKPIEARSLRATVERVLFDADARRERAGLAVLFVDVGARAIALPLACVERVVPQPACRAVVGGPAFVREAFELEARVVPVLELAALLATEARARYVDRSLVVVAGRVPVALAVDRVRQPEIVADVDVARAPGAVSVRAGDAFVPVIEPTSLVDDAVWSSLTELVAQSRTEELP